MERILFALMFLSMPFFLAFDNSLSDGWKPEVVSIKTTDTAMIFTITTQTYGGQYSPKHCLAIWVTDQNDVFKKTLKLAASTYKMHLVKWNQMSAGNVTDAITGASLDLHTTHTVVWNGKDKNGVLQPNGQYKVFIEFTEENSLQTTIPDGPWTSFTFTKGITETQNPANFNYTYNGQSNTVYKDIVIKTFVQTNIDEQTVIEKVEITPNPASTEAQIRVKLKQDAILNVSIYNNNGTLVRKFPQTKYTDGEHIFFWYPKASKFNTGTYFVKIEVNSKLMSYKLLVL